MFDFNKRNLEARLGSGEDDITGSPIDEVRLEPEAQQAMARGLGSIHGETVPDVSADFNAGVLACLRDREMFEPANRMAAKRLRWMALPAVVGFITMYGICQLWSQLLNAPETPLHRVEALTPAPPLPPLPVFTDPLREHRPQRATEKGANNAR